MPVQGPIDQQAARAATNRRTHLEPEKFAALQKALRQAGQPGDPCAACGCRRDAHLPKPTFSYAKSGGSSGRSVEIPVLAPTSCDCPHCICSCVAYREPEYGQRHWECVYQPSGEGNEVTR